MRLFKAAILAGTVAIMAASSASAADVKIGFIVKQPEESWFQDEWKFAEQAGKEKGFTVVKIGAEDGEKVQSAIDNLGAQGAQGFIVCTPDVKLGPGIVAKAAANDLKLMTVDDRLVDADGKPLEDVPDMGISATKIGEAVGEAIAAEIKKRGWDPKTVGAILDAIGKAWEVSRDVEVTLEANPTSVEATRFVGYRKAGVNRVSLGVQALDDASLKALGRLHTAKEALDAVAIARAAFDRYSFDLIYARPGLSNNPPMRAAS